MIEIGHETDSPLETWKDWPRGTLRKGDIVRVSWNYDGVHGPVWVEDTYLLLEGFEDEDKSECWSALVISEKDGTGEKNIGKFRRVTIHSEDFRYEGVGDWQRISLMVRAEDGDC